MADNKNKYEGDEESLTQVRSIIKHLNEDKPSQERSRKVVGRAEGATVVRVTRKRKVMISSADKRRRTRMQVLFVLAATLLVAVICGAFLSYRMAVMSSSAYMEEKRQALQQLWGATQVQIEGAGVDGSSLSLANVVVDFPEESQLQRVELSGVRADLELMTFVNGCLKGETLEIDRVRLVLRNKETLEMPLQSGRDMWDFSRMDCKDFSVVYAEPDQAPVSLKNAGAYMYYPSRSREACVIMLRGGALDIRGWKTVRIAEGKLHVSGLGVDDFSISGTTDAVSDETEQRHTRIAFAGKLPQGASLYGPFALEAENMSLADFTDGRLEKFLGARTVFEGSSGRLNGRFFMTLNRSANPRFAGELHLRNVCLSSFPALMAVTEHIEPGKRRLYNPVSLSRGFVRLSGQGDELVVEMPDGAMSERDLATLRGTLRLSGANELSGELSYGIPMVLARVEYPDGQPDPIFQANGEWAVLHTRLRGLGNMPDDDMSEVEARASIARRERPERIPFSQLDVNRLTEQLLSSQPEGGQSPAATPQAPAAEPAPVQPASPTFSPLESDSNPFGATEDPFSPSSTPF